MGIHTAGNEKAKPRLWFREGRETFMGEVGFVCERAPCGKGWACSAVKVSALRVALPPVGLKQGRLKMNLKLSPPNEHPGVVRFHIIINFL